VIWIATDVWQEEAIGATSIVERQMYEILGMGYGRERDARQNLRLAARRITEADERYELIDVQRRVGWGITARRAASSERRQVRAAIGESLAR